VIEEVRIKLSALWVCLVLTYLLGDVLRIFSGGFEAGEVSGMEMSQGLVLGMAALMLLPIVMVFLSLALKYPAIRWVSIVVGLVFNALTACYAWKWVNPREKGGVQ
jgi:hypothetical protein